MRTPSALRRPRAGETLVDDGPGEPLVNGLRREPPHGRGDPPRELRGEDAPLTSGDRLPKRPAESSRPWRVEELAQLQASRQPP